MRFWKTVTARLRVNVGGVSLSRGWMVGTVVVLAALALSQVAVSLADASASTPPQVVSLSYSPSSADVTNGSVPVTFTAHLTDSSDIQYASIWLQSRSTPGQDVNGYFSRVSGTAQDGIWQATINLPQGAAAGAWDYNGSISDAVNHFSFSENSYGDQNLPADAPGPLTVTDSTPSSPPLGADDFARADSGGLGAGWAAMTVGGLAISGDTAVATSSGYSGDIRTGEDYGSDQYSQITLSSQLTRRGVDRADGPQPARQSANLSGDLLLGRGQPEARALQGLPRQRQLGDAARHRSGRATARRHHADTRRRRVPDHAAGKRDRADLRYRRHAHRRRPRPDDVRHRQRRRLDRR